jgi:hypothetical protein
MLLFESIIEIVVDFGYRKSFLILFLMFLNEFVCFELLVAIRS